MAKAKKAGSKAETTTTIRCPAELRAVLALHGQGNISQGVRAMVSRHHALMRQALPELGAEECKAVCGAMKGYPLWAAPEVAGKMALGPALAHEIHDYRQAEPGEAEQWELGDGGWQALESKCTGLADLQVLALAHACEAFFQDNNGGMDDIIWRHFRVRG